MADGRPFVHLHCHTHYSLLDGANRIPDLVKKVKASGMNAAAITDHGNLYGALEFYNECKSHEINPIIGYEAYVAPKDRRERNATRMKEASFHLTLLAMNRTGFQNLVRLSTVAFLEGFYYKPRIDVGSTLIFGVHGVARFLSNCGSHSDTMRGVMNKRYLVKLDKDELKELSKSVKKERIAAKKRTHAQVLLLADAGNLKPT